MSTGSTTANKGLTDNPTNNTTPKVRYNFWRGHPNHELLPTTEMQEIFHSLANDVNSARLATSLQYLANDRGDPELLTAIREFVERRTLEDEIPTVSPPSAWQELDMFVTHGVSHGLDILCTTQTQPGEVVLVERPTYFLGAVIFKSHGLQVQSLPMMKEGGGVNVEALEKGLETGSITIPRMIYIVPTHQNPTGHTMPLNDRWKLCQLALQYGFLVAADEVYHLLDWRSSEDNDPKRPARFSVLDRLCRMSGVDQDKSMNSGRFGGCVSVNSFTKILTPGVRCGWIEGPKSLISSLVDLGYIQSQGGCAPFVGEIMRTAIVGGWQERILNHLISSYRERCRILCDILESEPGIQLHCQPLGGFFVWVNFLDLPQPKSDRDAVSVFAEYCMERGVKIMPGVRCDPTIQDYYCSGQPRELCYQSARLCFADMDQTDVEEGAKQLVQYYVEFVELHTNLNRTEE